MHIAIRGAASAIMNADAPLLRSQRAHEIAGAITLRRSAVR